MHTVTSPLVLRTCMVAELVRLAVCGEVVVATTQHAELL